MFYKSMIRKIMIHLFSAVKSNYIPVEIGKQPLKEKNSTSSDFIMADESMLGSFLSLSKCLIRAWHGKSWIITQNHNGCDSILFKYINRWRKLAQLKTKPSPERAEPSLVSGLNYFPISFPGVHQPKNDIDPKYQLRQPLPPGHPLSLIWVEKRKKACPLPRMGRINPNPISADSHRIQSTVQLTNWQETTGNRFKSVQIGRNRLESGGIDQNLLQR